MKKAALSAALLLCATLLLAEGGGERALTLYYTSSLNGNLDGCNCRKNPKAGLVKRAAWLHARRDRERSILVDAGDILDVYPDEPLSRAILDSYAELGYDAVAVGDQELTDGIPRLLEYRETVPLICHNLTVCPDETRCVFVTLEPLLVSRGGLRIGIFALIDPEAFALYPEQLTSLLKIPPPAQVAPGLLQQLREQGAELTILLYHGPYERARALALEVEGLDVVVVGHEQQLIDAEQVGDTTFVSPGSQGNHLGILSMSFDSRGRPSLANRFEYFRWETSPDDPQVRRRILAYREALRGRVLEQ